MKVFVDKDVREAAPDGEGKYASWRNKKARYFTHFLIHKSTVLCICSPSKCSNSMPGLGRSNSASKSSSAVANGCTGGGGIGMGPTTTTSRGRRSSPLWSTNGGRRTTPPFGRIGSWGLSSGPEGKREIGWLQLRIAMGQSPRFESGGAGSRSQ